MGVRHTRQQDLRRGLLADELVHEVRDALVEQVISEIHHERFIADERFADEHGVREATRGVLLDIGDRDTPGRPVADRRPDFSLRVADDDADLLDAGLRQRLDTIEEHGLVGHGHKLLGAGIRERPEPRASAAAENQSLH